MKQSLSDDFELDDIISNIQKCIDKNKQNKHQDESYKKTKNVIDDKEEGYVDLSIPDYYKLMGLRSSDSQEKITSVCNEKMAQYHPDKINAKLAKYPQDEQKKQKKRYDAQYQLVREARDNLINPEKRKYYDLQRKNMEKNVPSKKSFDEFIKSQESEMTPEHKMIAISTFKSKSAEYDKKHGFDSSQKHNIETHEFKRRFDDLQLQRGQQDADCMPENMFDNTGFTAKEFNKQWEIMQKKKEKKKKAKNEDKTLIKWEGVSAYNDHGNNGGDFMSLDNNDDGLYKTSCEEDYIFSTKLGSDDEQSVSSLDDEIEEEIDVSYYDSHNKNKDISKTYEKLMREREHEQNDYENRKMTDASWKDVYNNPFNISHQMGELIGNDIQQKNNFSQKEMNDAYKSLMWNNTRDKTKKLGGQ